MAVAVRGGRGAGGALRSLAFFRIFASAMFTLLSLAALSVLITSDPSYSVIPSTGNAYMHKTFTASFSDPSKTRLDLLHKQATDHMALVNAYASYARKLKIENSKQLKLFDDLARNFSDFSVKPSYQASLFDTNGAVDEEVLRRFEKEVKDKVKLARTMIAEAKESYDNQLKIQKLKDTIFAVNELLVKAKKNGALASFIAAKSTPKSMHCLAMRLMEERVANPDKYKDDLPKPEFEDPSLYHYAIFSNNVIAISVVINSVVRNADGPQKLVFHVVADRMYIAAMQVWFKRRPIERGAHVEVKAVEDFTWLELVPVKRFDPENKVENATTDAKNTKVQNPEYLTMLNQLRFYLPEMYPKLKRILFLEDDVVVQKDLTALWKINMDGKVNGAVETCFGSFHRYSQYLNFSNPLIKERFNSKSCSWAYGINIFDLDAWRREKCTEQYHYWRNLNEDGTLWKSGTLPPGLVTFYSLTKSLDKSWHVLGLGYNPSISMDEINHAAVIHFNGNMKPWLDIALNQYKNLWTKYVDYEMEFLQMCNFGV